MKHLFSRLFSGSVGADISRRTVRNDMASNFFGGATGAGQEFLFLFLLAKYFHAPDIYKSLIATAPFLGMLFSVFFVNWAAGQGVVRTRMGFFLHLAAAPCLLVAAFTSDVRVFVAAIVLAGVVLSQRIALGTQLYRENHPANVLGNRVMWSILAAEASLIVFSRLFGSLLDRDLSFYRWILVFFAAATVVAGYFFSRIPCRLPVPGETPASWSRNPWRGFWNSFSLLWRDRAFGWMIANWFLFGLANLTMWPLRVLYLSQEEYGLEFSASAIVWILVIVPQACKIAFYPFWAMLFDRMNIHLLRILLNLAMGGGMFAFFFLRDSFWLTIATGVTGFGLGGGNIAWNLWVTRFSPPERTSEYMSIHLFFNGIRGVAGAFLGIGMATWVGVEPLAAGALSLVLLSCVLLVPWWWRARTGHRAFRQNKMNEWRALPPRGWSAGQEP